MFTVFQIHFKNPRLNWFGVSKGGELLEATAARIVKHRQMHGDYNVYFLEMFDRKADADKFISELIDKQANNRR